MLQKPFKPGYICIARCAFTYSVAFNTINNGPKNNLAVLTGGLLTGVSFFFFTRKCMAILPGGQKSGHNITW